MYADDGQLYTADTDLVSLERRITHEVASANAWYEINGMIANPSKHQGTLVHFYDLSVLLRLVITCVGHQYHWLPWSTVLVGTTDLLRHVCKPQA